MEVRPRNQLWALVLRGCFGTNWSLASSAAWSFGLTDSRTFAVLTQDLDVCAEESYGQGPMISVASSTPGARIS